VFVELLICDLSAVLYLQVESAVVVRLCEENVFLRFGKLYSNYHRRVLRFLIVLLSYSFSAIHVTRDKSNVTQPYVC
jgi:hypothetical protein